jgi:hypothetical protein
LDVTFVNVQLDGSKLQFPEAPFEGKIVPVHPDGTLKV